MIRLSTADMLSGLGHFVTEAANGKKALELLEKAVFDVIVTDISLPGMSGEEIAAAAVKQQAGLRVIFATGYEASPGAELHDGLQRAVMLRKPYDEQQMATALNAAISKSGELTRDQPSGS